MNLLSHVLATLYRSEINCSISTFWDSGWEVKLGDFMNGWKAQTTIMRPDEGIRGLSIEETALFNVAVWLDAQARIHFPDSDYVKGLV